MQRARVHACMHGECVRHARQHSPSHSIDAVAPHSIDRSFDVVCEWNRSVDRSVSSVVSVARLSVVGAGAYGPLAYHHRTFIHFPSSPPKPHPQAGRQATKTNKKMAGGGSSSSKELLHYAIVEELSAQASEGENAALASAVESLRWVGCYVCRVCVLGCMGWAGRRSSSSRRWSRTIHLSDRPNNAY